MSSSSIVRLSEGRISFRVNRDSEADETSGILLTKTYNYKRAKWLDENLKPLSVNDLTINDIFPFADDLHETKIDEQDMLVSYDVSSLFRNGLVDETIEILTEKPFKDDRLNRGYDLNNITKTDLIGLLQVATKNQLLLK